MQTRPLRPAGHPDGKLVSPVRFLYRVPRCLLPAAACLLIGLLAATASSATDRPLLALDPGHSPKQPGALGCAGVYEVTYNDRFVAELIPLLEQAGWQVILTRRPEESISLKERTDRDRQRGAALLLSIHHDSVLPEFVQRSRKNGRTVQCSTAPEHYNFRGFSLFISARNPRYAESRRFAALIGRHLRRAGREPALYHADPVLGENRPLLDKEHGIHRYDELSVLRRAVMPAVLLEVGVILDEADEAWIDDDTKRRAIVEAVAEAAADFRQTGPEK